MIRFVKHISHVIGFFCYFFISFIKANIIIGFEIIRPGARTTPAIVQVPLKSETDLEITLLSCLISLTPGTLALAIQTHPATLYVHGIFAPDADEFRRRLSKVEARMLKALRYNKENQTKKENAS